MFMVSQTTLSFYGKPAKPGGDSQRRTAHDVHDVERIALNLMEANPRTGFQKGSHANVREDVGAHLAMLHLPPAIGKRQSKGQG